jgi:hypothetical protein
MTSGVNSLVLIKKNDTDITPEVLSKYIQPNADEAVNGR